MAKRAGRTRRTALACALFAVCVQAPYSAGAVAQERGSLTVEAQRAGPPSEAQLNGTATVDERAVPLPQGPASIDTARGFVDGRVSDVRVSETLTVATVGEAPQSACPSTLYIYERERPKWLFQTGRLLQAMREGAAVRISFTCRNGFQSINALQFLPPAAAVSARTAGDNAAEQSDRAGGAFKNGVIPLPARGVADAASREERVRTIPLP